MSEENMLQQMERIGDFKIMPTEASDMLLQNNYVRLDSSSPEWTQVNALLSFLPELTAADSLAHAYSVSFPDGVAHTLLKLKNQPGYYGMYQGENGRFKGAASLNPLTEQGALLGAFTVMSIASSQYFLAEINDQLKIIKLSIDKILAFLYGDKKAELMAEISFVKYAHQNYDTIMRHNEQRQATIASLQTARKVAMKDIEFYLNDLDFRTSNVKDGSDIKDALQIKASLELSLQLYLFSSLLEVYFADNYEEKYIHFVEEDLSGYVRKCEGNILSAFSRLEPAVQSDNEPNKMVKTVKKLVSKNDVKDHEKEIIEVVEKYRAGEKSEMQLLLHDALSEPFKKKEYIVTDDNVIYLKTA